MFKRFLKEEEGQTLVEYGLLISLIAITAVVAVTVMGSRTSGMWGNNASKYPAPPP